jgi:autotransporter-associated beta strand protein
MSTTATFDTQGNTLTIGGMISGQGGLAKTGTGDLVLSGPDTYSGGTDVESGKLILASSDALLEGSSLTVGANGESIFRGSLPRTAAPVPESGTLLLLSVAGIVAAAATWRRRRA